ncbi:aminoglycoside phosphotransferase [Motiliproteus coralliicola]|uniref:Aminoglycoside phosphotransferase n=1 Tax=Motiliproteus coralliicola TaxID=2283196 RepID=A0A369WKK1_9GAMM|nr:aminoglycoside phosphotransferase [Motiliproteus coralliicola]
MDQRLQQLRAWIPSAFEQLGIDLAADWQLQSVSGDASFRRYFRVRSHNLSWIAVDAPPQQEDSAPFVAIARAWEALEIHAPQVHLADLKQGFMLLSDLGDTLYLDQLNSDSADLLYRQAQVTLTHIQQCRSILGEPFPPYDRALLKREMGLFSDWFLEQLLGLKLTRYEQRLLEQLHEQLIVSALEQPQVCVHRDYHSRNLMVIDAPAPGVIDFQDAVWGPITYDLVSLLRDCYVDWPEEQVRGWALAYAELATEAGIMGAVSEQRFLGWFDRMGMQRHLKAIGIFARLKLRDGKPGYLADIPRTLDYLRKAAVQHDELAEFGSWLDQRVVPAMGLTGLFDMERLQQPLASSASNGT